MRSLDWKLLIGGGALLATFVLALPGVKAVRAEGSGTPLASGDGPTCSQSSPEAELAQAGAVTQPLRQQIVLQIGPAADGQVVMLNNRGYNYGPGDSPDRETVDRERPRAEP